MFFHSLKYSFLDIIRTKTNIFWVICFPMILGTLFNFAFMGIYDNQMLAKEIPVAVVNGCDEGGMKGLLTEMEGSDNAMLKAQYVDEDEAEKLLKESKVDGIIYDDLLAPKLTVRAGASINSSIIKVFTDRYKSNANIVTDIMAKDPSQLQAVIENMSKDMESCLELKQLNKGNFNPFTSYFYNLLAMSCMFVSMAGMLIPMKTQANLSAVGARRTVSATSNGIQNAGGLAAAAILFYIGIAAASAYLVWVLGIDFGISFGEILIVNFFGLLMGLSLGFFIGSIGRLDEKAKTAIVLAVSLFTGFCSGLMASGMPILIENNCPILNRINPSRLITDTYYCINAYGWEGRATTNLITLAAMSAVLMIAGCVMTSKKKFKSI